MRCLKAKIIEIINEDVNFNQLYKLIISVVRVGFVTAVNLMIYTNGFTIMRDGRKLTCYCRVVPFAYQSGTSIKERTRVHPMANKKLKCNLHMASLSAVRLDAELKSFYERKVAEGKSKMSILNAVKNKLLAKSGSSCE